MSRFSPHVAFGVALLLAGCGAANHPTTSARVVSTAAANTTMASTARVSEKLTGSVNGESLGEGSLSGVVDSAHHRASIAYDLAFLAKASAGMRPGALVGRVVHDGDNAFVSSPAITRKLPPGRRWIEITSAQGDSSGSLAGGTSGVGTLDETKPVDHLRAVAGKTEELGREAVNGEATRHYRTQLDYRLYVPLVARRQRAGLRKAVAKLDTTLGSTRFPAEVWIAADGTIRRAKGVIEGRGLKLEYTLELTAIGKPVRLDPPPAARVLDARKP